jgi:hypothetical protein
MAADGAPCAPAQIPQGDVAVSCDHGIDVDVDLVPANRCLPDAVHGHSQPTLIRKGIPGRIGCRILAHSFTIPSPERPGALVEIG